ncbi:MAG: biosynthetic-type acetolactate synthase large subunit [Lachnospiraceae bacterium]|nr:biosynthetic-type acetolactate synthase large subunit [Lachnospiraceae bacterium]
MKLKGAEIVIQCLLEQGVDTVFGYPGGTILDVYDALLKHETEIRHIRTSHEQGAAHAADGYARASGKTGVCFATSGPGSTNLVTGLATAYMDSIPVVAVTCNVTNPLLGKDSFQEVDIAGITMPITKHGFIVKDVTLLADTIRQAFAIAKSGRPGPVIVDITKDTTQALCEYEPQTPAKKSAARRGRGYTNEDIAEVVRMIVRSKKPYVYAGGGAVMSEAEKELKTFVETIDAPVTLSLMGKGAFDERSPLYSGMIGMHGTKASNLGVSECDLLIALGARFSDRVIGNPQTFAKGAEIIHIDIDVAEINKNIKADKAIVGDLKTVLKDINAALTPVRHTAWVKHIQDLKRKYPLYYDRQKLSAPMVVEALYDLTKGENVILSTDVGQHQMWAAQYYPCHKPRTFLTSGGLGTMGYGLGAAIGAQVAAPKKRCINIAGDGCFRMNMNELMTASAYGIPVIEIVINNRVLGMVRQWQTLFYDKHYSATTFTDRTDFCKIAEGMGCRAMRITKPEEVLTVLKQALSEKGPVVVECVIGEDDSVFPMVPAGASIADAFDAHDLKRTKSRKHQ